MQLYPILIACLLTVSQAYSLEAPPANRKLRAQQLPAARPDLPVKFEDLRVVVVNDIIGHFEVLAGVLHTLRQNGVAPTTLYTGPGTLPFDMGLLSWLGLSSDEVEDVKSKAISRAGQYSFSAPGLGDFHKLMAGAGDKVVLPPSLAADLVICVSPELAQHECERILKVLRPSFLVTFVHRGESITKRTTKLYPRQSLVALSPHVATACQHHTRVETSWTLPIAPYMDPSQMPCKSRSCLDGFVVQGHIRGWNTRTSMGYTRDYAHLWRRLLELRKNATGPAPDRVHVTVLGKGDTRKLAVPPELAGDVLHMQGLQYPEFWGRMHRSLAILPLFGNEAYYTTRLSSTILASVITGTPLIADRRLLSAYSFLTEQTVFLQLEGEDEAAAMVRVQAMPAAEVMARRQALLTLREQLYERNAWLLSTWLEAATAGPPVQTVSASLPSHKKTNAVLETEGGDYYAPGTLVDETDLLDCDAVTAAADQGARQLSVQQDKKPKAQHIIITRALRVGCRGARRQGRRAVTQIKV